MIEIVLHLDRVAARLDRLAVWIARMSDRLQEWSGETAAKAERVKQSRDA